MDNPTKKWFGRGSTGCVGVEANSASGVHIITIGNEKHGEETIEAHLTDPEIELLGYYLLGIRSPGFIALRDGVYRAGQR